MSHDEWAAEVGRAPPLRDSIDTAERAWAAEDYEGARKSYTAAQAAFLLVQIAVLK